MCNVDVPGLAHWNKPTGWICPKCGNVYAPSMFECVRCNHDTSEQDTQTDTTQDLVLHPCGLLVPNTEPKSTDKTASQADDWVYFPDTTTARIFHGWAWSPSETRTQGFTDADARKIRAYYTDHPPTDE